MKTTYTLLLSLILCVGTTTAISQEIIVDAQPPEVAVDCVTQPSCDECAQVCCDTDLCCGLLGCIAPSDQCFSDFISPMINPLFFEDPRTVTEIRPIVMLHNMPSAVGNLGLPGGDVEVYAVQIRAALSDRLSFIAVKDGYIVSDQVPGSVLDAELQDGWAAVTAGLKYNLCKDACCGTILSAGATYEIPIGSQRSQQDVGDGEFHLFLTGGQRFLDGNAHVLSTFGWRLPADSSAQTTSIHWSNHVDVRLTEKIYAVTEFSWWHWTDSADPPGIAGVGNVGFAGQDLLNIAATNVDGNDLVTQGVGVRLKPRCNMEVGAIYEFPLTDFEDIIDHRWTFDMILRY